MEPLSREQILGLALAYEDVQVPAWGRRVRVRELTLAERDLVETQVYQERKTGGNLRARLLARVCLDAETGERLFTDADVAALGKLPARVVQPLHEIALRLSGLAAGEADELGKGSAGPQPAPSSSSSPETSA